MNRSGKFIISLDFELLWGLRDHETIASYGEHILGVHQVMPKLLELFKKHEIKVTFATVGFLFASKKEELINFSPEIRPKYDNFGLSPYNGYFNELKNSEEEDKYHFASKLIDLILKESDHEIATHTFSHYYCLEKGQTSEDFKADLVSAIQIADFRNISLKSIVFPRNQVNNDYLDICYSLGLCAYRGIEKVWFYEIKSDDKFKTLKRAFRLLDTYINLSGNNCYSLSEIGISHPYNIRSSRYLRPYSPKLRVGDRLKIKRIVKSMTFAAKTGKIYHLNWHPHNFGIYQTENLSMLNEILAHFSSLRSLYDFESLTMNGLAEIVGQSKIE